VNLLFITASTQPSYLDVIF